MSDETELARRHLEALLAEAGEKGVPADAVGRALLGQLVERWLETRPWNDVADELRFTADSLDPDRDYEFMRP